MVIIYEYDEPINQNFLELSNVAIELDKDKKVSQYSNIVL